MKPELTIQCNCKNVVGAELAVLVSNAVHLTTELALKSIIRMKGTFIILGMS